MSGQALAMSWVRGRGEKVVGNGLAGVEVAGVLVEECFMEGGVVVDVGGEVEAVGGEVGGEAKCM